MSKYRWKPDDEKGLIIGCTSIFAIVVFAIVVLSWGDKTSAMSTHCHKHQQLLKDYDAKAFTCSDGQFFLRSQINLDTENETK